MMRAPKYMPAFVPVRAFTERYSAPDGPNLANAIGRTLAAGGAELGPHGGLRSLIQSIGDDNAGRARALQDHAALNNLVEVHGAMTGGTAVAAQPQAIGEIGRIAAEGQDALGNPGMVAAYDQELGPSIEDATSRVTGHALAQLAVERQAVAAQTLQNAQASAAAAWQDPSRFVDALGNVKDIALGQTDAGRSDADRAASAHAAVGMAVAGAVGQALAAGEPEFAAHIVNGWGETLTPAAYQLAVARLGQVAQNQHLGAIVAHAAGGNPVVDANDPTPANAPSGTLSISAPTGAAVHPIAGGLVHSIDGAPADASVKVTHPDGSSATYGGLGMSAVAPGDLVTPAHVIGSASPTVTLSASDPSGGAADAGALLDNAGGSRAMIGNIDTQRRWDLPTLVDRIAQRQDISPDVQALATNFAQKRVAADQAQQASADLAAGRSLVSLAATAPGSLTQAADLPAALAGQMTPSTLAKVDSALRHAAQVATLPAPDSPIALRLELMQRREPGQFAQVNLAPLIGTVHPADLSQLATSQASIAAGQTPDIAQNSRGAVLDAMARHEFGSGTSLPDETLPAIKDDAETRMRLNLANPADQTSIDSAVKDAIQIQIGLT